MNMYFNYIDSLVSILKRVEISDKIGNKIEINIAINETVDLIKKLSTNDKKIIFIGNGGSAAIASHCAIDYSKNGKIRSICFNESSLLTCLSNDFGYENVFLKAIELYANKDDILVAISSSGRSSNIINAVLKAHELGCFVITFSGFNFDNSLRKLGNINYYINSNKYGLVELSHQILLHMILDIITGDFNE